MIEETVHLRNSLNENRCPKCGETYHFRVRRAWLVRQLSFILRVKRYYCARCKKKRYVWVKG